MNQTSNNGLFELFYKISLNDNTEFKVLDLAPKKGRHRTYGKIVLPPLYTSISPTKEEKRRDMMDLLPYIPKIFHICFISLTTKNQ